MLRLGSTGKGIARIAKAGINFHASRVGSNHFYVGNIPMLIGKMGHRRRSRLKHAMDGRLVRRSVGLVGRRGVGAIHGSRCPTRPC